MCAEFVDDVELNTDEAKRFHEGTSWGLGWQRVEHGATIMTAR